jgi:glycosyltransferase involved in cell wall biosynthesis
LAREYAGQGHSVTIVTMGFNDLPRYEKTEGCAIYRVACGRQKREMSSPLEGLRWTRAAWPLLEQLHAKDSFDATHAHFIMPAGILAARMQRTHQVPFLVTAHGSDVPGYNRERLKLAHWLARPWWRRICKAADHVVCPSHSIRQLLAHSTPARTSVCPYGFDASRFRPGDKGKHILLCSRLVARKGFQYFLQGIRDLELPDWNVDLVGDGPLFSQLEALARHCRMPVAMHGWLNNEHPLLDQLYARAMIYVMPSEWENFPVALQEGMSAGCAVITCDVSGNPEVVGDTGLLVPPRSPAHLRHAVLELTREPARCLHMGQRARERVLSEFEPRRIAQRHLTLMKLD